MITNRNNVEKINDCYICLVIHVQVNILTFSSMVYMCFNNDKKIKIPCVPLPSFYQLFKTDGSVSQKVSDY